MVRVRAARGPRRRHRRPAQQGHRGHRHQDAHRVPHLLLARPRGGVQPRPRGLTRPVADSGPQRGVGRGRLDPPGQQLLRGTGVDGGLGPVHALRARPSSSATRDTVGSLSPDAVASAMPALSTTASRTGPWRAGQQVARRPGRCARRRRRAGSRPGGARGRGRCGSRVQLGDRAVAHPPHGRGRGQGELVEAVVAAEDGCRAAAAGEDPGHERGHPGVGAPRPRRRWAAPGWSAGRGS